MTLGHRLRSLGVAQDCHFAYRLVVVLMRRDLPLAQVGDGVDGVFGGLRACGAQCMHAAGWPIGSWLRSWW